MVKTIDGDNMKRPLQIRGHHLLCIQGYQGYGYDRQFEINMSSVKEHLMADNHLIEVVTGLDVICASCPHAGDSGCNLDSNANETITLMDQNLLKALTIRPGTLIQAETIFALTNTKLQSKLDLTGICDQCRWQQKCLWFQSRDD